MHILLEEFGNLEKILNHTSLMIYDLETTIGEDIIPNTAIVLNHIIKDVKSKYSLDLELLESNENPLAKYQHDIEGIKELLKSTRERYDKLLVKYRLFVRKIFLKALNGVSMRKSALEDLLENLPVNTTNEDIPLAISRNLHAILPKGVYETYPLETDLDISGLYKSFKKEFERNDNKEELLSSFSNKKLLNGFYSDIAARLKSDKYKESLVILVRANSSLYTAVVTDKGDVFKSKALVKNTKRIRHGSGKDMEDMLKKAIEANEDFSNTIEGIFSILKDAEDYEVRVKEVDSKGKANAAIKKFNSTYYSTIKDILPWMAFQTGMHLYTHIGYVIAVAKDFSKER